MDKQEILARVPFYRDLPPARREQIESMATLTSIAARTQVFSAGDACREVVIVGRGTLRVFVRGETGREITLYTVEPGETCLMTLVCATSGARYPAAAVAETDVLAAVLPARDFLALLDDEALVRAHVFKMMGERMLRLMALVDEVAFRRMDNRLAEYLAHQFAALGAGEGPVLEVTHERIAMHLGSVREVVSRLLKELEREGVIELGRGQIRLRDEHALRRLAGPSLVARC